MPQITICIKSIAKKQPVIVHETLDVEKTPKDVRELISEIVNASVKAYEKRAQSEVLKVLTTEQIEDAAISGKVGFGINYNTKMPVMTKAVNNAIQSFEDGLVCIFSGDRRLESLDECVTLDEPFTFIRLSMLCGRMW